MTEQPTSTLVAIQKVHETGTRIRRQAFCIGPLLKGVHVFQADRLPGKRSRTCHVAERELKRHLLFNQYPRNRERLQEVM